MQLAGDGGRAGALAHPRQRGQTGAVDTPLIKDVVKDEAFRTKVLSRTPLGRFGAPAEVAAIVAGW